MNVVAHNLTAMNAQRQFKINTKSKSKSAEKLSSGYKINLSADDAAGLAISEKMRWQIRGLDKGSSNAQDGVSLCQVADGALAEVSDMLHRITELSVQAANDTNTDSDRQAIQKEINQILTEIDRVGDTTEFNTMKIFTGAKSTSTAPTANDYVTNIQNSFSISGVPTNMSAGTYTISADDAGITIDGNTISWQNITDGNGNTLANATITAGNYSFDYNGMTFSLQTADGTTLDNVTSALNSATFDVDSQTRTYTPVTLTSYDVQVENQTDSFLLNNRYGGHQILADENGITVNGYGSMTWAQMGIDDLDNAGGKTINFSDSESGLTFTADIAAGATASAIINSINGTTFKWNYIDMATDQNARLGIDATSMNNTFFKDSTKPLTSVNLSSVTVYDGVQHDLFKELGYTTPSSKLSGLDLSISLSGSTKSDLKATITDSSGTTFDIPFYNFDIGNALAGNSGILKPVFGQAYATINLSARYSTVNPPTEDEIISYLGSLGEIATDVIIPNPYTYSYSTASLSETVYSADNITTLPYYGSSSGSAPINPLNLWIQSGAIKDSGMYIEIDEMNTSVLGIDSLDVSSTRNAGNSLTAVSKALEKVSANRSRIGAQQNRLEHTIKNNDNTSENTSTAESRLRDTDMANEMVKYSKSSILEQVGQSVMAQANQNTQGVISLLQS